MGKLSPDCSGVDEAETHRGNRDFLEFTLNSLPIENAGGES